MGRVNWDINKLIAEKRKLEKLLLTNDIDSSIVQSSISTYNDMLEKNLIV